MMSDYLFAQYKKRAGVLPRDEFDERQEILKAHLQGLLINSGVTVGEFSAACADVLATSVKDNTGEIAYVFSMAGDFAEDMRGLALEREGGGNA